MTTNNDATILAVAARSAGVCTRAELIEAGVAATTITGRVRSGLLVRVGSGVYQIPALTDEATPLYRAVRSHRDGVISHGTAAIVWEFPVPPTGPDGLVEITSPRPASTRPGVADVLVHRSRRLSADDVTEPMPGLPVTTPARTILDLAATFLFESRLRQMVQAEVVRGRLTLGELAACLDRGGGRGVTGSGRMRRILDDLRGQPVPESELERRLAEALDRRFLRQFRPPWYDGIRGIVDFADPDGRIIVEADGRRWHAIHEAMVEDRRRDRLAAANGWLVIRVTWSDVIDRPEATIADIDAAVARRSRTAA